VEQHFSDQVVPVRRHGIQLYRGRSHRTSAEQAKQAIRRPSSDVSLCNTFLHSFDLLCSCLFLSATSKVCSTRISLVVENFMLAKTMLATALPLLTQHTCPSFSSTRCGDSSISSQKCNGAEYCHGFGVGLADIDSDGCVVQSQMMNGLSGSALFSQLRAHLPQSHTLLRQHLRRKLKA
jgi:hypothetical protein